MTFAEDNAKAWSEITELHHSRPTEFGTIETANGPGATVEQTRALRECLPMVFRRYGIKSVLDVGCGDWNWMQHVDLSDLDSYVGWDVEPSMIAADVEQFADRSNVSFAVQSLLTVEDGQYPQADLILARHVLIHFPNEEIVKVLDKMRASGVKYLLTSHWPDGSNEDYEPEGFAWRGYMERALDMEAAPFNLPQHVEAIHEPAADAGVLMAEHELALYELIPAPGLVDLDYQDVSGEPFAIPPNRISDGEQDYPNVAYWNSEGAPVSYDDVLQDSLDHPQIVPTRSAEGCEHASTYRVHRANDTVATVCAECQTEVESKGEAGGMFSFHDTIARWAADAAAGKLGASDKPARMQGRPASRKELLRGLKENHREVVNMVANDTSLQAAWLLLGAQTAVLDAILDELLGARDV